MGSIALRKSAMGSKCSWRSSTPAFKPASKALSGIGSQAPNTSWSGRASGTMSFMRGVRLSGRLPRRIVASWVIEPTGCPVPRLMCSTPAMNVEDTAPRPTKSTPSLPPAELIVAFSAVTKSLGSRPIPCLDASSRSRLCHCAGILPVLTQCCTVLWRLPSIAASVDCPPKRSTICLALLMMGESNHVSVNCQHVPSPRLPIWWTPQWKSSTCLLNSCHRNVGIARGEIRPRGMISPARRRPLVIRLPCAMLDWVCP